METRQLSRATKPNWPSKVLTTPWRLLSTALVLISLISLRAFAGEDWGTMTPTLSAKLSLLLIEPEGNSDLEASGPPDCEQCRESRAILTKTVTDNLIMVQDALGTNPPANSAIGLNALEGKRVLSMGDGKPGTMMTPYLREHGIEAYGVDLDETYLRRNHPVFKQFGQYLIKADVTKLSRLKIAERPFDEVVSSHLLCSLPTELVGDALIESLKVLRSGGSSRHIFAPSEISPRNKDAFNAQIQSVVTRARELGMRVTLTEFEGGFIEYDKPVSTIHEGTKHTILIFNKE